MEIEKEERICEAINRLSDRLESMEQSLIQRSIWNLFFKICFLIFSALMTLQLVITDVDHHQISTVISATQQLLADNTGYPNDSLD